MRRFIGQTRNGAIFKTLSTPSIAAELVKREDRVAEGLHTSLVDATDPDLAAIDLLSGLCQHYVEKAFEARVTVVGDTVFSARIDSQANARTRVVFRHFEAEVDYQAMELPRPSAHRAPTILG